MVGGTTNAFNGSNVFSPMLIEFSLMRVGDFPHEDGSSPNAEFGRVQRWVPPSLGEASQEKYEEKKKKERKRRRRISERKEKKREKKACKVGSRVGAPS